MEREKTKGELIAEKLEKEADEMLKHIEDSQTESEPEAKGLATKEAEVEDTPEEVVEDAETLPDESQETEEASDQQEEEIQEEETKSDKGLLSAEQWEERYKNAQARMTKATQREKELEAKIAEMLQQNPGDALVAQMTEFIVANRKAAESVAELKDGIANLPAETVSGFQRMGDAIGDFQQKLPTLKDNLDTITKSTFKGMSDGLMDIVKGTASVGDAFKKMAAQLIMQAIQLFVIDKITGGFLSFVKGLTGKAIGGPVQAGQPYMVGERGPEMFVPNQSGSIVPNDKMGGKGITVVNNVDARGSGPDVDIKIQQAMQQTSQATIASIQDLMRRRRFV